MLDDLNIHYDTVARAISDGRVVFFLGAGANLCGRPVNRRWQPNQFDYLPNGTELAAHLAAKFSYPPNVTQVPCSNCESNLQVNLAPQDLARVSQFVVAMNELGPLYDELHDIFNGDHQPTAVHRFLANLPAALREKGYSSCYQLLITTNYDDVLEHALWDAGEPFDLISYIADGDQRGKFTHSIYTPHNGNWPPKVEKNLIKKPNQYCGLSLEQRTIILKIHGTVNRPTMDADQDSYVITEDHYIDCLTRTELSALLPKTLAAKLSRSHILFLGHGLRDWNLRVILHRIWVGRKLPYKSWAIQSDPELLDKKFWEHRGVEIFSINLETYVSELSSRL